MALWQLHLNKGFHHTQICSGKRSVLCLLYRCWITRAGWIPEAPCIHVEGDDDDARCAGVEVSPGGNFLLLPVVVALAQRTPFPMPTRLYTVFCNDGEPPPLPVLVQLYSAAGSACHSVYIPLVWSHV